MQTQIQNEDGESIESISYIENIPYRKPFIIFDTLKPTFLKPEIKTIQSPFELKELHELGICLYSTLVKKGMTWSPRQKLRYYLRYSDLPSDTNSKLIKSLPINHLLENDIANNKIRMVGRFISRDSNKTEWFKY